MLHFIVPLEIGDAATLNADPTLPRTVLTT